MALSEAGDQASDKVVALRDRLRDALAEGKDVMKDIASTARRQAAQADEVIRANPYAAIGVATGLGLLAGYLISRSCCTRN